MKVNSTSFVVTIAVPVPRLMALLPQYSFFHSAILTKVHARHFCPVTIYQDCVFWYMSVMIRLSAVYSTIAM